MNKDFGEKVKKNASITLTTTVSIHMGHPVVVRKYYSVTFSPDLDPCIYIGTLYKIVEEGGDLLQRIELSPRFARRQQKFEFFPGNCNMN